MNEQYYYGTGRRKTAVARVRLYMDSGPIIVNGRPVEEAFPWDACRILFETLAEVLEKNPTRVIKSAVKGMLPITPKKSALRGASWSGRSITDTAGTTEA